MANEALSPSDEALLVNFEEPNSLICYIIHPDCHKLSPSSGVFSLLVGTSTELSEAWYRSCPLGVIFWSSLAGGDSVSPMQNFYQFWGFLVHQKLYHTIRMARRRVPREGCIGFQVGLPLSPLARLDPKSLGLDICYAPYAWFLEVFSPKEKLSPSSEILSVLDILSPSDVVSYNPAEETSRPSNGVYLSINISNDFVSSNDRRELHFGLSYV